MKSPKGREPQRKNDQRERQHARPDLSVVVPLYNEEMGVPLLVDALVGVLDQLPESYEVVLVDDGSSDGTWAAIGEACADQPFVRGVSLLRNFGHQGALYAGMAHADGRAVITMDGDLQHPPEVLPELVAAWRDGYAVVNTQRVDSADVGVLKRFTSRAFYRFFSAISGLHLDPGSADFRLLRSDIVDTLLEMRDPALFLRGAVQWIGCPAAEISFQAGTRETGRSQYSLRKMLRLATDGVVSFSTLPLRLGIWLGVLTGLLAFVEIGYILVQYGRGNTVPGWASLLTVMSFMFGVLFLLLGILGTYLAKVYEAVKGRPSFLTGERTGWEEDGRTTAGRKAKSTTGGASIGRVA